MNTIIAKYVKAYQDEKGSPTEKVKKILMHHAHSWEWDNSDGLVADLIDDSNITADDIIAVLANADEMEDGNQEFHYAVRALQICLRKAELAVVHSYNHEVESFEEDGFDDHTAFYIPKEMDMVTHYKYQE